MKGLILKDLYLMKGFGKTYLIVMAVALFMLFSGNGENLPMVLGYMTVPSVIMVINTISYDEASNGYSFLMTLPVTREKYVLGKYVISTLSGVLLWLFTTLLGCFVIIINSTGAVVLDWVLESLVILGAVISIEIILIPIQIKFGMEKGRIILILATMVVALLGYVVVEKGVFKNIQILSENPETRVWIPYAVPVVLLICWFLSYNISCLVMRHKEL